MTTFRNVTEFGDATQLILTLSPDPDPDPDPDPNPNPNPNPNQEWRRVLLALGWVDETADAGRVQREARRAEQLLVEARLVQPISRFEPAEREAAAEWAYALVELPAVHVRGSFALWQRGLPPHRVYPALSARMPAALFHAAG